MNNLRSVTVSQLANYDEIIDVRSPAEFADDHIPGAINAPVLSNEQRAHIGTLYKQVSPFVAKKEGAALIARNVADALETHFWDKSKSWRPLVYCWRGGQRSGAMAHILAQVGWSVAKLEGGYKAYRQNVLTLLETSPRDYRFVVLCGATGSGKSRLLQALQAEGAQALDLEWLAKHRGSLLGYRLNEPQPSQKMFEGLILNALKACDPAKPIFVEAESKKIGKLVVPANLIEQIRQSPCVRLEVPMAARVAFLKADYAHFLNDPALFGRKISALIPLRGRKLTEQWIAQAHAGEWDELVESLLSEHYDLAYRHSTDINFIQLGSAQQISLSSVSDENLSKIALTLSAEY